MVLALSGCQDGDVAAAGGALGGTEDASGLYPAVGLLWYVTEREGIAEATNCTATLIAPQQVLTAAHCVDNWPPGGTSVWVCFETPALSWPAGGGSPTLVPGACVQVADCAVHPDYNPASDPPTACGQPPRSAACAVAHDAAVLFLHQRVPPSWISPLPEGVYAPRTFHRLPSDAELATVAVTDSVTQVGMGRAGTDITTVGTRRYRSNTLAALELGGPDLIPSLAAIYPGDSGGPMLRDFGGASPYGLPPIGVACGGTSGGAAQGHYTSFITPSNIGFIRGELDRDGGADGRFDYGRTTSAGRIYGCLGRGYNPAADATNDADGDGYLDATEDPLPGVYSPCPAGDSDGDTVPDELDNCPGDANLDQSDRDADGRGDVCDGCPDDFDDGTDSDAPTDLAFPDGIPDACDNCPLVFNPGQEDCDGNGQGDACDFPDADGDRHHDVCDDNCPPSACPTPAECRNDDQANCNLDAELATSEPTRGDVCDPSPCPDFRVLDRPRELWPPDTYAIESSGLEGLGVVERVADAINAAGTVRTGFRFCQCDVATEDTTTQRVQCAQPPPLGANCVVANPALYDAPAAWRTINAELIGEENIGGEFVIRYGDPTPPRYALGIWNFVADGRAGGFLMEDLMWYQRARGVIWSHGIAYQPRPIDPPPTVENWGCLATGDCPAIDRRLSSHYSSGELQRTEYVFYAINPIERVVPAFFPEICPVCISGFPLPILARECGGDSLCARLGALPPELGAEPLPPFDMGLGVLAGDRIAPEVLDLLSASELRWIAAAEPSSRLHSGAVPMAAIDPNQQLVAVLRVVNGQLVNTVAAPMTVADGLPGSYQILLGEAGALVTIGGTSQGVPRRQLEWTHLDGPGGGVVLLQGALPSAVEGAAVDLGGRRLLVADRNGTKGRWLLIDLDARTSVQIGSWTSWEHVALASLPDGRFAALFWTASQSSWELYTFRLDTSQPSPFTELRVRSGSGVPLAGPYASHLGVTLVMQDQALGWVPVGIPFTSLDPL